MKHKNLPIIILISFAFSFCSSPDMEEVVVNYSDSIAGLTKVVDSICLIPLETDSEHLLGSAVELIPADDTYVVADLQNGAMFRYSAEGRFLNSIGHKGRGPAEYARLQSVQNYSGDIIAFSAPDKMLRYSPDGVFIAQEELLSPGHQSFIIDDNHTLTYYSYLPTRTHRLSLLKDDVVEEFLETRNPLMTYMAEAPVFSEYEDEVFVIDSYSDILYRFSNCETKPYLRFNFGRYSIYDDLQTFEDAFESAYYLSDREFALINRYQESLNYKFVEILVQKEDGVSYQYGLYYDDEWHWFSCSGDSAALSGTFRLLNGDRLLCILDPMALVEHPLGFEGIVSNNDVLSSVNENSNYVIACINLK